MSDLRLQIADVIVRKVLQEDYDDLVEGYLDEILMAADQIILLPAYKAVSQAYYDKLSSPVIQVGREEIAAAFIAGAMSVHEYWVENPGIAPSGDPEFGEAAHDYAADAILAALGTKATNTGREG